jgi:uncharacterized membrane protein
MQPPAGNSGAAAPASMDNIGSQLLGNDPSINRIQAITGLVSGLETNPHPF